MKNLNPTITHIIIPSVTMERADHHLNKGDYMNDTTTILKCLEEISAFHIKVHETSQGSSRRTKFRRETNESQEERTEDHKSDIEAVSEQRKKLKSEYNSLMKKAKAEFNEGHFSIYKLSEADLDVIAQMYEQSVTEFDLDVSVRDIVRMSPVLKPSLATWIEFIRSLQDREIISNCRSYSKASRNGVRIIMEANYSLNGLFFSQLIGDNPFDDAIKHLVKSLSTEKNPVNAFSEAIGLMISSYDELAENNFSNRDSYYGTTVNHLLDSLLEIMKVYPDDCGINKIRTEFKLSDFDIKCLMLALYFSTEQKSDLETYQLANLLCRSKEEHDQACIRIKKSPLFTLGLLNFNSILDCEPDIELGEKLKEYLESYQTSSLSAPDTSIENLVKDSSLLSLTRTSQKLKDTILPKHEYDILKGIIRWLKHPVDHDLSKWGLMNASLSDDNKVLGGCNILLHGHPGTGKTYVAGVIANELGRDLISINAGKMRDMFYGNTEKNMVRVFKQMKKIIMTAKESPVFLLNEGDQLIHSRKTGFDSNTDQTENAIQNIFLEEMESFPGILIVTTNLACNLDEAMSRRFHYKLEFGIPDYYCQLKLWDLHLPATIPGAKDLNLEYLASRYSFTGGQIRIVVQNACHQAISRGIGARLLLSDLEVFCRLEAIGSFENTSMTKQIGFCL